MAQSPAQRAFRVVDSKGRGAITQAQILARLAHSGILDDDERLQPFIAALTTRQAQASINARDFERLLDAHDPIIRRALLDMLTIPDFQRFSQELAQEFQAVRRLQTGAIAEYIPELARMKADGWGLALSTIDGQRLRLGDAQAAFTIQSLCKQGLYGLALELHGRETVHRYVGREASGQKFNALTLNEANLPHNPMINAGAIVCASLIAPQKTPSERFEIAKGIWSEMAAGRPIGFSGSVYTSERQSADRNYALAYFMRENKVFPPQTNMMEALDLYFQACALETSVDTLAITAATLANAGVCPLTGKPVIADRHVKNCLSMMFTAGMYNYSGEFAFLVGMPAKSGISGGIIAVVPGLLGFAAWSPRVDDKGNSVRGVEFCKRLVARFAFHQFDTLGKSSGKIDPRNYPSAHT